MLTWLVNFLTGLLRWIIITYLIKPFVDWAIINPLTDVLQGGPPVDVVNGAIESAINDIIEDAVDASVEVIDSAGAVITGTI